MLAKRLAEIQPSQTLAISAKAKELKKQGKDILSLSAGEPDFVTPSWIREAALKAIQEGHTHYPPVQGILPLRRAVCQWLKRHFQLSYSEEEILISAGAKHSLYNLCMALLDEGEEVLIPKPYWVSYPEQVRLSGGKPVFLETTEKTQWKITPEQLKAHLRENTKLLILNTPSNPTGAVYTEEELLSLWEVLKEHPKVFLLSDEIYAHLVYEGKHTSPLALESALLERALWVGGVSKSYAMTGWRIGFAAGPKEVIQGAAKVQSHSTSGVCSIAQYAALAALEHGDDTLKEFQSLFAKRREIMAKALEKNSFPYYLPKGAFYFFVSLEQYMGKQWKGKVIKNTVEFCQLLLEAEGVALVPGEAFGRSGYVRLSYATSEENIQRGIDRLGRFCAELV